MKRRRILAFLLTLAMVLTYMPVLAFADAETVGEEGTIVTEDLQTEAPETEQEPVEISEDVSEEPELIDAEGTTSGTLNVKPNVDIGDSDELLMEYLEQGMPQAEQSSAKLRKAESATRGSRLNGNSWRAYAMLYNAIIDLTDDDDAEVATQYIITSKQLSLDKTSFTKKDLGVNKLIEGDRITTEATEALVNKMGIDQNAILCALLSDMPYYLYWFDKTKKTGGMDLDIENVNTEADSSGEVNTLIVDNSELTFSFTVAGEYQDSGNKYKVNLNKIRAANDARKNAANIITENENKSDYLKLIHYMNKICEMTSYHNEAGQNLVDYGDPWQMIYVFDGDAATKVVCEGYSKAFQFLCDNSTFSSKIECDSVTGKMKVGNDGTDGGDHMWNVLHMEDGKNYIADLTNCDEDSIGEADADGGPYLFLNGCKSGGSVEGGYVYSFKNEPEIRYTYDKDTKEQYKDSELIMSDSPYSFAGATENAASNLSQKAVAAESAVAEYQTAASVAKKAADKAASTLDAKDIADAQTKAKAAEELKAKAEAALKEADKAQIVADNTIAAAEAAIEAVKTAIANSELKDMGINDAVDRVAEAKKAVSDAAKEISTTETTKSSTDTITASAVKTTGDAATKRAEIDKAAADKAAADKAAAAKAAEYAANGNAYIDPKLPKVKIKGPKKAKKSFTAKWTKLKKKQQKAVKGIEIEYSLTSDFKDPKFKTAGKKKTSLKIKGLKSKKTYYVRAHTFVYRGGKKYVSNWSAPKKVKVK